MALLEIENAGPELIRTNYWESPAAAAGKFLVSLNAGAFRVLVPPSQSALIAEMATAKTCVISRGPWPAMGQPDGFEILFDDGTADPFTLHLSRESFDRLPAAENAGGEWVLTVWSPGPVKVFGRPCGYRIVPRIPWLKPWKGGT